jgi:hypothetical protein
MTQQAEIDVARAIALLQKSGAVFLCAYGFPGDSECFVEGMGDQDRENATNILAAIGHHFKSALKTDLKDEPF